MTIDMQSYAGEPRDSAAEGQQIGANSYQQEAYSDEVPVDQEILEQVSATSAEQSQPVKLEVVKEPSPQELNFKALREEVDRIKSERDEFRQNLELLRANVQEQQRQAYKPPEEPKKFLDGMGDHEVPNVSEIRKAFEQRESEYRMRLEELQVQQTHPDYAEVLEKYTTPLLKQKPHLAEGIYGASNKALFAYELGKMAQQQYAPPVPQPAPVQPSAIAQKIVENSRKPGNIGQAGGQSALSQADYYASMSDNEFMKMASKNLGEI